ncbi:MAG: FAD:protein FMN transferase [Nannocystaceae bacterium]|nr:FAD:protein FMN transferase [Nannocystaceae bacterium]
MGALIVLTGLTLWRLYFAPTPPRIVMVRGQVMGTTYRVKVVAQTRAQQSDASEAALAQTVAQALDNVDLAMSTYKPDSELSRFNDGPADQDVSISSALADVLTVAFDVHERSSGAFDVTVGPLVERWGFGAKGELTEIPSQADVDALRGTLGHEHLIFDAQTPTLRKDARGLRVDLSAIAKGYGVDRAAAALHEAGWDDFLVEVGGEVRVSGKTEAGRSWRLAVEKPSTVERAIFEVIELEDGAMATSGDYRNFTVVDGTRYSHTIDPTTGRPVTHQLASVSVVADTCAEADALATALNVLGPRRGLELAQREGLPALFLVGAPDDLEVRATDAWRVRRIK